MKISVLVATPDKELAQLVNKKKSSLLDAAVLQKARDLGANVSVSALVANDENGFMEFFEKRHDDLHGVFVVLDNRLDHLKPLIAPSLFVVPLGNTKADFNAQNQLRASYNLGLRAFLVLVERFCLLQFQKILLLPLENFAAKEIVHLKSLFSDGVNPRGFGTR